MAYGYITALKSGLERKHVRFKNRFDMALAGDLYAKKGIDGKHKYPAIIVGAPYGGVKEQGPSVYANELASRGYVVLTFDQSFMGESSGEPRNVSDPSIFIENFSACVDYLGTLPYVDREAIGVVGICGSGAFGISAAAQDTRIKAVATAALFDIHFASRMGQTPEQIQANKEKLSFQRWADYEKGTPEYLPSFPEEVIEEKDIPEGLDPMSHEFFEFYALKRGHHNSARGGFTSTSNLAMMNFPILDYIKEVSPRPILFIAGEKAISKFFTDNAYAAAAEPKEYIVVPNANHIDMYDDVKKIPFERIDAFFKKSLGK